MKQKVFKLTKVLGFKILESGVVSMYFKEGSRVVKIEFKGFLRNINEHEESVIESLEELE